MKKTELIKPNMNTWAKSVAIREDGKKQVSIGQIKQIMKIVFKDIYNNSEYLEIALKNGKRNSKQNRGV